MEPRVSIVITTFNRPLLLVDTLASIFKQKFRDFEVIVIDDGNDEQTPILCKAIEADEPLRYFKLNRGSDGVYKNSARPINVGIRKAVGEIIILQNAECRHRGEEVIQRLTDMVGPNNAAFAQVSSLNENGKHQLYYCHVKQNPRPYFFCGAILREWFEKLRGLDEDYTGYGYEDDDFAHRLAKSGVSFVFTDIEVEHQWHKPWIQGDPGVGDNSSLFQSKQQEGIVRNQNREWGLL